MRPRSLLILLLTGLLLPAALPAVEARAQLEAFVSGSRNLSASFEQRSYDPQGFEGDSSSGSLALARPNRFRWDYLEPEAQHIVADGDNIWIHDVELEQVSVRPQAAEDQQSPLSFLLDPAALEEQYRVEEPGEDEGQVWLLLLPLAEEANFAEVLLGFRDEELRTMRMTDQLGQRTEILFRGWQRNQPLADSLFRFVPPAGVDLVGEAAPSRGVDPLPD